MEVHPMVYNLFIDPLLRGVRNRIAKHIEPGMKVVDIACGTGRLARQMAASGAVVTGVDIEPSMIRYSGHKNVSRSNGKLQFFQADARSLQHIGDKYFDLATMSLALHQFSSADWGEVLNEALRISGELLIADYYFPLPTGSKKSLVYIVERIAGKEHSRNFRAFMKVGGVIPIIEKYGMKCSFHERSGSGIFGHYRIVKIG